MDPTATLKKIRALQTKAFNHKRHGMPLSPEDCEQLVELVAALDDWLGNRAGDLPLQWRHVRPDGHKCERCGE
jgi:hypothetical protein